MHAYAEPRFYRHVKYMIERVRAFEIFSKDVREFLFVHLTTEESRTDQGEVATKLKKVKTFGDCFVAESLETHVFTRLEIGKKTDTLIYSSNL